MDDRWRTLIRVRDLRARLALNEVSQQRRAQARAQATLDEARRRQAHYEEQANQASALLMAQSHGGGATFSAAQAQELQSYAVGARLKVQEAAAPIHRAQVQCQRAQEAADEARAKYLHEAGRKEVAHSQWRTRLQAAQRRLLECEDEALAEARVGTCHTR